MTAAVIAFSETGYALGERIVRLLAQRREDASLTRCPAGGLAPWVAAHVDRDALVFVGSCGIAVRGVAPFVGDKQCDPAVLVVDELGHHVIPLLSGHLGGANRLALWLAGALDAVPVITTATDLHGVFAVDSWAAAQGLRVANPARIKGVSARLLAGEALRLRSELPLSGPLPQGVALCGRGGEVVVSHRVQEDAEAMHLVPPVLTLGVVRVCSVHRKAEEPGILAFCRTRGLPYRTFSAEALGELPGPFAASAFVEAAVGVDNVCERSAVLGGGAGARLLAGKTVQNGVAMALAISPLPIRFEEEGRE